MKISVIIPVYGVEKYIRKCLESVINQTYKNLEIIIVNDETKDNSIKIVEEYIKDPRIRIINKKNEGVAQARNCGLKQATGEYISFIDSDDWLELDLYEKLISNLENEDILVFNYNMYNEKTKKTKKKLLKISKLEKIRKNSKILFWGVLNGECWNKLYKKQFLNKRALLFGKNKVYEDTLWGLKTLFYAHKIKMTDYSGYFYRVNREGSLIYNEKDKVNKNEIKNLIKELEDFRVLNSIGKIEKFYLELIKINFECSLLDNIDFEKIEEKINIFLEIKKSKIENFVIKKLIHKILKNASIKKIKLNKISFWYNGIYTFKVIKKIVKNKNYLIFNERKDNG